ncbi:MAG: hypothetical protein ABL973_16045 [Micropepsaceae bacterium]
MLPLFFGGVIPIILPLALLWRYGHLDLSAGNFAAMLFGATCALITTALIHGTKTELFVHKVRDTKFYLFQREWGLSNVQRMKFTRRGNGNPVSRIELKLNSSSNLWAIKINAGLYAESKVEEFCALANKYITACVREPSD